MYSVYSNKYNMTEFLLVNITSKQLDVTTTTDKLLLMIHRELQHECLLLVAELRVLRRDGIEPVVL